MAGAEEAAQSCQWLAALKTDQVDAGCFRLKPRHGTPPPDESKPWIWILTFSIRAPLDYIEHWHRLASISLAKGLKTLAIKPAKQQDGPLAKQLSQWLEGYGTGAAGFDDEEMVDPTGKRRKAEQGRRAALTGGG